MAAALQMAGEWYALIGAHLTPHDIEGVGGITAFDAEPVILSAIAFDPNRGIADPEVVRRALEARAALIARETFIAIRYGAAVQGEHEARLKCAPYLERWHTILEMRRGMVEITVRIVAAEKTPRPDRKAFATGAGYLRALHQARRGQLNAETARSIEATFDPLAAEQRWVTRQDGTSELVLLVRRTDLDAIRAAGLELKSRSPHLPFLLSGPWPLEVFADDQG